MVQFQREELITNEAVVAPSFKSYGNWGCIFPPKIWGVSLNGKKSLSSVVGLTTDLTLKSVAYNIVNVAKVRNREVGKARATVVPLVESQLLPKYFVGKDTWCISLYVWISPWQLVEAESSNDVAAMNALLPAIKFNGGGHLNHTIFWTNMAPNGGGEPSGAIADAINAEFSSFQNFKVWFL